MYNGTPDPEVVGTRSGNLNIKDIPCTGRQIIRKVNEIMRLVPQNQDSGETKHPHDSLKSSKKSRLLKKLDVCVPDKLLIKM